VHDRKVVYDKVVDLPPHLRISTFGIGRSFDEQLVRVLAEKGRGSVSRVYDLEQGSLAAAAVKSLNRAMYPSLSGCSIKWAGEKKETLNEVFYNELVSSYKMIDKKASAKIGFTFECEKNP